jgi:hypothetical protein
MTAVSTETPSNARSPKTDDTLKGEVAALGIEKIQQAGSTAFIRILADIARILSLLEVPGSIELHYFVVARDRLIGIGNIGENRIAGCSLLLLCLGERVIATCDLSLITIEDGQFKIHKDGSSVLPRNMR